MKLFIFTCLILNIGIVNAYRILCVFPYGGKSHFVMFESLIKGLAKKGHQVDVISHYPLKEPFSNYTDIISLSGSAPSMVNNLTLESLTGQKMKAQTYFIADRHGNKVCDLLGLPKMQEFVRNPPNNPPYDLVITEIFAANCYIGFGHHLHVPVIGVSSSKLPYWANDPLGNPDNTAYVPLVYLGIPKLLTFWERLHNTIATIIYKFQFKYYTSVQNDILRKYFGPDIPDIRELEKSLALILVNSHYSFQGIRPFTPAIVEVGGLHVQENDFEIDPKLEKWLNESEAGVIYFTFGSMMKIESFPDKTLAAFYKSFAKITPVRVLMKVSNEDELPSGLPKNVITLPWISQIQVLKHKNTRAFITHGGLMGIQEALYYGVPLIGIPLFGDQTFNIKICEEKKMAVSLDYRNIDENNLDSALSAVLKDPIYREAARKASANFLDRPVSAMDTAIFWVQYVVRNGAASLRSPAVDLTWWQIAQLDVFGTILLVTLLTVYLIKAAVQKVMKKLSKCSKKRRISNGKKCS